MKAIDGKGSPTLPDDTAPCGSVSNNDRQRDGAPAKASKAPRMPRLGRHSSGQARALFNGRMEYFGAYGPPGPTCSEPETLARYAERCKQWLASGGRPTVRVPHAGQATLTVRELLARYREGIDASGKYRKRGVPTSQRVLIEGTLANFERFVGTSMRAVALTEATIVQWRDRLEAQSRVLVRTGINRKTALLLQAFAWARKRGLLPRSVWSDISVIEPLRASECGDRPETGRVRRAVTAEDVEAVATVLDSATAAVLRVQALTGARPGEAILMRWRDLDRAPRVIDGTPFWTYNVSPDVAKTSHHNRHVTYPVPPEAQRIIDPQPAGTPGAYVFTTPEREFSLAGVPPLAGFLGKWSVLQQALAGGPVLVAAALALLASTAIFAWSYLLIVRAVVLAPAPAPAPATARAAPLPLATALVLLVCAAATLGSRRLARRPAGDRARARAVAALGAEPRGQRLALRSGPLAALVACGHHARRSRAR